MLAFFQAATEWAPLPMATVEGPAHIVRSVNPAFCRLLARPRKELVGKPFREILPGEDESEAVLDRVLHSGEPETHDQEQHFGTPPVFWSYTMWPVMLDERPAGVIVQVTENTQQREKTVEMNEALILGSVRQHELAESADALTAEAKKLDLRKNQFLAMLAHELRNPLAPIRYMVEIMKRAEGKGDLIKPGLDMIERQVGQMTRLIDDLLDVGRITRDKLLLRQEDIELAPLIRDVAETFRSVCEVGQLELSVTLPPQALYLHADSARLTQVFGNLLQNACKFTRPGGHISLNAEQQGRVVVVTVKDSGIGISADMLPKIFEMFTQGDQTLERSQSGLGIGLTLVRRLVTLHDGSVQAFSAGLDKGSQLVVRLPLSEKTAALPAPTVSAPVAPSAQRILVVDDNEDAANILSMLLQLSGNETHVAFDGVEAVEAAEKLRPDVILMDIGMPKLNGYGAARQIREQPWGKAITLVAVTGLGRDEDRKESADAGFDGHLVKPVEYGALTAMLARLPNKHTGEARTAA
jgi:signal transduction histidine kinase/ActR/RegA family two-component response regulator